MLFTIVFAAAYIINCSHGYIVKRQDIPRALENGTNVVINEGETYFIPKSGFIKIDYLTIRGMLECSSDATESDLFELSVNNITIENGVFRCTGASETSPYQGQLKISVNDPSEPNIKVHGTGKLNIRGRNDKQSWTRIYGHLGKDGAVIKVPKASKWREGDEIVIAPSDYAYDEYETFKITSIKEMDDLLELTLDHSAKFFHHGETIELGEKMLEARAEVALLTRNIKLYGNQENYDSKNMGISISFFDTAAAFLDNVEIRYAGQQDKKGGYPIHFHLQGEITGQTFANSSIYLSKNRCISIHCTENVLISRTSCIDHIGHGYFLEDGTEVNNVLEFNLGVTTRPGSGVLIEDDVLPNPRRATDSGPSTFWLSAAGNTLFGNVAAGSSWLGFNYIARKQFLENRKLSSVCRAKELDVEVIRSMKMGVAENFLAHSTSSSGFWILGHEPESTFQVRNIQAYKNGDSGIFLDLNNMIVDDFVVSDTYSGIWSTWSSTLRNGVISGRSSLSEHTSWMPDNSEIKDHEPYFGTFFYDGPSALYDILYMNFNVTKKIKGRPCHFILHGGSETSMKHPVAGLSFQNPSKPTFCNRLIGFLPKIWDLDGSLSGVEGGTVGNIFKTNPAFESLTDDGSCKSMKNEGRDDVLSCGPKSMSSLLRLRELKPEPAVLDVTVDGEAERNVAISLRSEPFNDFQVRVRPDFVYRLKTNVTNPCFEYALYDGFMDHSYRFIITDSSFPTDREGNPDKIVEMASLEELAGVTKSSYFHDKEKKETHFNLRMSKTLPLIHPKDGSSLNIGQDRGVLCF